MFTKWLKTIIIGGVSLCLIGGFLFGKDMVSYLRSSARSVRTAVKDTVPVDFELRRARDLLEEIIPEMHANIKMIAQEEVEVAALKADIGQQEKLVVDERMRIQKEHDALKMQKASYTIVEKEYSREHLKEDLARRFERFKEAEMVLKSKHRLLTAREKSLQSAIQLLEKTRSQKLMLQDRIEGLESQYRLVQAAAVGSTVQVDNTKLAQTEKLIRQIKKRLDVAERVLAHESRFVQPVDIESVNETGLLNQIDEYFHPREIAEPETISQETEVTVESGPELCKAGK